jgi:hypothetical protein
MEATRGQKHPSEAENGMKESIYWIKFLMKVSQQPQKPLNGSNQIWAMISLKKDTATSEVTYVATAAAAAGSNIPLICRYKIEGCSTDSKNMKHNSSLKLQIISILEPSPHNNSKLIFFALIFNADVFQTWEKETAWLLLFYVYWLSLPITNPCQLGLLSSEGETKPKSYFFYPATSFEFTNLKKSQTDFYFQKLYQIKAFIRQIKMTDDLALISHLNYWPHTLLICIWILKN